MVLNRVMELTGSTLAGQPLAAVHMFHFTGLQLHRTAVIDGLRTRTKICQSFLNSRAAH